MRDRRKKTHGCEQKKLPREVALGAITKPFFASFISVAAARIIYSAITARAGESNFLTIFTIGFCAVIYLPISLFLGAIERDDLLSLKRR